MKVRIDVSDALSGLADFGDRAAAALTDSANDAAREMEAYAKTNRPWTDRTGNARRTLEGVSELAGERLSVGVEGHMPYSVFLELGFDGRYAVLQETVNALAPKTLADIAGKLRDLR